MNLIATAPMWLVWILVGAVVAAAVEDSLRLRISNLTCAVVALAALVAMAFATPSTALLQNFALFALILVVGTFAFSAGLLGGGDIKLLAATGLWLDLRGGMLLVTAVLLAGGIVAIAFIAANLARRRTKGSLKSRRVPYGIAIALGALFTIALSREPQRPPAQHYTLSAQQR
jgi:prepilin peptidase CpaA